MNRSSKNRCLPGKLLNRGREAKTGLSADEKVTAKEDTRKKTRRGVLKRG